MLVGGRLNGAKELVAAQDSYREDTQSWLDLLRDLGRREITTPALANSPPGAVAAG